MNYKAKILSIKFLHILRLLVASMAKSKLIPIPMVLYIKVKNTQQLPYDKTKELKLNYPKTINLTLEITSKCSTYMKFRNVAWILNSMALANHKQKVVIVPHRGLNMLK